MGDDASTKGRPATVIAIVSTLLLGLVATRGSVSSDSAKIKATKSNQQDSATSSSPTSSHNAILSPFSEAIYGKNLSLDESPDKAVAGLESEWHKVFKKSRPFPQVQTVVALVSSPVKSSVSYRYDQSIDSIQRAALTQNFVLEQWRTPWREKAEAKKRSGLEITMRFGTTESTTDKSKSTPKETPGHLDPGLLVFRKLKDTKSDPEVEANKTDNPGSDHFLLVFLVTETPTQGIDRPALIKSLDAVSAFEKSQFHTPPGKTVDTTKHRAHTLIRILGPSFSGSMPSLRDGMLEWIHQPNHANSHLKFQLVSGTATGFDFKEFKRSFPEHVNVEFSATMHQVNTVIDGMLKYLGYDKKSTDDQLSQVVVLSELNTGWGGRITPQSPLNVRMRYPLHIGQIRRTYESQGALHNEAESSLRAALEIRKEAEEDLKTNDLLANETPAETSFAENRALTQSLKYLEDGEFKTVIIVSTDVHDAIFLARIVNRYCPDATICLVASDLMLLDPESIVDMRGILVGSTYPLFAMNHIWTNSDETSRAEVFSSDASQGIHNAMVALLLTFENSRNLDEKNHPKDLLSEYATPRAFAAETDTASLPPVWIGRIGERAIYPVACITNEGKVVGDDRDYLYARSGPALVAWSKNNDKPGSSTRIQVDRIAGWFLFLMIQVVGLIVCQLVRRREDQYFETSLSPADQLRNQMPFTVSQVMLAMLLGFSAIPLYSVEITRLGTLQHVIQVIVPLVFIRLIALEYRRSEMMSKRFKFSSLKPTARSIYKLLIWIEPVSLLVISVIFGCIALFALMRLLPELSAFLQLQAVRMIVLSSGLTILLPLLFITFAVMTLAWASHRLQSISRKFALPTASSMIEGLNAGDDESGVSRRIGEHRAKFDSLFEVVEMKRLVEHIHNMPRRRDFHALWTSHKAQLFVGTIWLALVIDTFAFRQFSDNHEGPAFKLIFPVIFVVSLWWVGSECARLVCAWKELRVVLREFSRRFANAFRRIPNRTSAWFIDPDIAKDDYCDLILRQVAFCHELIGKQREHPPKHPKIKVSEDLKSHLDRIQYFVLVNINDELSKEGSRHGSASLQVELSPSHVVQEKDAGELVAIVGIVRELAIAWKVRPATERTDEKAEHIDEKLFNALEDLVALEAARWIGSALARLWTIVAAIVMASICLLFAISSYPFTNQARAISVVWFLIVVIAVIALRLLFDLNRNEALNHLASNDPGKLNLNPSLFYNFGAFLLPLVGVMAALSFEAADLFRSILGPILRLVP